MVEAVDYAGLVDRVADAQRELLERCLEEHGFSRHMVASAQLSAAVRVAVEVVPAHDARRLAQQLRGLAKLLDEGADLLLMAPGGEA